MGTGERIRQRRTALGMTQQELADAVRKIGGEITQSGVDKIEKRNTERPRYSKELAQALGVNEEWLLKGRGPIHHIDRSNADEMGLPIPIISWVSAGSMALPDVSSMEIGRIVLAGLGPGDWIALIVEGDSMDRISPPGSIIVVNRADKRLIPNGCYVLGDDEGNVTYKRFRPGPPRRFEPVSTNNTHDPLFPNHDPIIIGRVKRTVLEM